MTAAPSLTASMRELLAWVSDRPRTYADTIEAWRTSCPRLSIWDDAISAGLVEVIRSGRATESVVAVTAAGRAVLEGSASD